MFAAVSPPPPTPCLERCSAHCRCSEDVCQVNRSWALVILLPSIMVELDVGGAEQGWRDLTFWEREGAHLPV